MPAAPQRLRFLDPQDEDRVVVEWIMSSVCNYDCSYCPAYLHDGRVRWPRYEDIITFCRRVRTHYAGAPLTFLLSGGEITLYRQLPALAAALKALPAQVAVLTNGSRPLSWWREHLACFDEVVISYHHEYADDQHLLSVARQLSGVSRVQINVVVDPAVFDRTMAFAARAEAETAVRVNRKVMFRDGWKRQAEYTPAQRRLLADAMAAEERDREALAQGPTGVPLKGDLVLHHQDGRTRVVTPLELINEGLNEWSGWDCSIGLQTLFIRFDEVWRAACRVGGPLGTIYDEPLALPVQAVKCTARSCNCIAGIKADKDRTDNRTDPPCIV